jgi:hypothetical protein
MSGPALGAEGDDHLRLEARYDRGQPGPQFREGRRRRAQRTVLQSDHVQPAHPKPAGGAFGLLDARGGQLRASRDSGMVANALGSVGGDDEMHLPPIAGQSRQQRADDPLVVGVGEDGEHRAAGLSGRGLRQRCGESDKASQRVRNSALD